MSMSAPKVSSWDLAEVGYQEVESSVLLHAHLSDAGFDIDPGVAGLPTAFVASWGSGSPVIGILAEFDALPGITQDRSPERTPRPEMGRGSRLRAPPLRRSPFPGFTDLTTQPISDHEFP